MDRKNLTKLYMWLVIVAGSGVVAWACYGLYKNPVPLFDWQMYLIAAVTVFAGSRMVILIPRGGGSLSIVDALIFLALLLYGGEVGVLLAAIETGYTNTRSNLKEKNRPFTYFFSGAVMACSTFLTVQALRWGFGDILQLKHGPVGAFLLALCVMAFVQYLSNTSLVAYLAGLKTGESFWYTWSRYYLWTSVTYIGGAAAAGLTARLMDQYGFVSVLAVAPVVAALFLTYRMYLKNVEVSQEKAEQAERHVEELNHYIERLQESEEKLLRAQKMEAVGQLAGGVAHDFNNLMTAVTGYAVLIMEELDSGEDAERSGLKKVLREDVEEIKRTVERASALTRQLLAFSRKQLLQPKVLELGEVVTGVVKMLRRLIGEDIEIVTELSPALPKVVADPGQLEQVIINLAVNARDAMPSGGRILIRTSVSILDGESAQMELAPGKYVVLSVEDTGCGMDSETMRHIFEPFYTTKEVGKGTGLGLATVHGIVKQSGGDLEVESRPGEGSVFRIYLPAAGSVAATGEAPATVHGVPHEASETVLLVEDEMVVRKVAKRVLEKNGYVVLEAATPDEALQLSARHSGAIQLLLTDVVMPRLNGRELAERLERLRPEMRVLYMSGYTDNSVIHSGAIDPSVDYLQKPFEPQELLARIRMLLDNV